MLLLDNLARQMPDMENPRYLDLVKQHIYRFDRAANLQEPWARENATCVDFYEGKQWDPKDAAKLLNEGRPCGTFNKIKRLVNLILGYQLQQNFEPKCVPDNDSQSDDAQAEVLSHVLKNELDNNDFRFKESQVFLDGLLGGRGYYDVRLSFKKNLLGTVKLAVLDPGSVYPDPDADQYDPEDWNYVFISHWMSQETILLMFGMQAYDASLTMPGMSSAFPNLSSAAVADDISPPRMFGLYSWFGSDNPQFQEWIGGNYIANNYYDKGQKLIRVIEQQHYALKRVLYFVDNNTGEMSEVPAQWSDDQIGKVLRWAEMQGGNVRIASKVEKRVRWTFTAADVLLYDDWSPYEWFTVVPFFNYFRRGKTRGFVADLLDPQREINKRRSAQIHIIGTTAYNGWIYEEGSLDPEEETQLKLRGSRPGLVIKYKKGRQPPQKIKQEAPPQAMERLEQKSADDLKEISGVNDSALGEVDVVQSGVAVQNRQKQTIIALEPLLQNLNYTRQLLGTRIISIVQRYYTEQRMIKVIGADGQPRQMVLNQLIAVDQIANDVTSGNYRISVISVPASDSFMARQFNELMDIVKSGVVPPALAADILIQFSSVPDKEQLRQRFLQAFMAGAQAPSQQSGNTQSAPGATPANPGAAAGAQAA